MDRVKSGKDAWVSMLPVGMLVFGVGIMLISGHLALRLLGVFFSVSGPFTAKKTGEPAHSGADGVSRKGQYGEGTDSFCAGRGCVFQTGGRNL